MGFEIGKLTRLVLGYVGENASRIIRVDMQQWLDKYPGAMIAIQVIRPMDRYKYYAAYEMEDGILEWTVEAAEVINAGKGLAQFTAYNPDTKKEYKSRVVETIVANSLEGFNDIVLEEADPANKWANKVLEAAKRAEDAVDKMPIIGENGNWWLWDAEQDAYVDSGKVSKGESSGGGGLLNLMDGDNDGALIGKFADPTMGTGVASMAIGMETSATGEATLAMGAYTQATADYAHAEGQRSIAAGRYAHAEGNNTQALGAGTHTEGNNTIAQGWGAHAEGVGTYAGSEAQHVQGRYNVPDTEGKYAHIVGNGESDNDRGNAYTLDWAGNGWYKGTMEANAVIIKSTTEGSEKRFIVTVDDTGTIKATEVA